MRSEMLRNGILSSQRVDHGVNHVEVKIFTKEERTFVLNRAIVPYIKRGYRVASRTETTAQLVKPKKFSFLWAVLWTLAFGVGLVFYLFYYAAKRDKVVYLEVDERGRVLRR